MLPTGRRTAIALLLAATVFLSTAGIAASAQQPIAATDGDETVQAPAFVVDVAPDGTGTVTVTYTFDLTDDSRQVAFDELAANETAKATFRDRFQQLLTGVANDASNATDREMAITDVSISTRTEGETGIVSLTATWDGLAAVDGDRLLVTEPFASGYAPDRTFVLQSPDGYTVDAVQPEADETADGHVIWQSGTDLDGFEATLLATDDASTDGSDDQNADETETPGESGPGFGLIAAILGVLGAVFVGARRLQ